MPVYHACVSCLCIMPVSASPGTHASAIAILSRNRSPYCYHQPDLVVSFSAGPSLNVTLSPAQLQLGTATPCMMIVLQATEQLMEAFGDLSQTGAALGLGLQDGIHPVWEGLRARH